MQNQQTQQNPQNGTQPFFPMGQGPNNFNPYQVDSNVLDPNTATRQGSEISSQIGGAAIGGAAINEAVISGAAIDEVATGASQAETPIPSAQESLDTQTLPIQESISNPEVGSVKTEATNITPFPSQVPQSSKDERNTDVQAQTDELPHMVIDNVGDSLSKKNQEFVKELIKNASENPSEFYRKAIEARNGYSESIRRGAK